MWIQSMHALYLKKYICAQAPPRTPAPLTETTFFTGGQTCGLKTQLMRMPHQKTSRQIQRFSLQSIRGKCVTLNLHERHWLSGVLGAGASSFRRSHRKHLSNNWTQECWGRQAVCEALYGGLRDLDLGFLIRARYLSIQDAVYHPWIREFGSWTCAWIQPSCFKPPLSISPCSMKRFHPSSSCSGAFGLLLLVNCPAEQGWKQSDESDIRRTVPEAASFLLGEPHWSSLSFAM